MAQTSGDMTPIGAERGASKDGVIPAWSGGLGASAADWRPGLSRPNPYADERPMYVVDASNVDRYADRLSPGQVQLIKATKDYRMDVYPTRRSCGYPQVVYDRTKANAGYARLSDDGTRLVKAKTAAVPFPSPKTGAEVMWNSKMRYSGQGFFWRYYTVIPPTSSQGIGEPIVSDEYVILPLGEVKNEDLEGAKGVEIYFLSPLIAPAQYAGDVILLKSYLGKPADVWLYYASQRRVRRAPTYQYDAPVINFENLLTVDAYAMFGGQLDRYDFKLLGKKELVVPYNWFKVNTPTTNPASVVGPKYLNRNVTRYELHRVWVVEATVKSGMRHTLPKRTFYLDEDTWAVVVEDLYDSQSKVQRVMESGPTPFAEIQACQTMAFVSYDLPSGRVAVDRLMAGPKDVDWNAVREGRLKESIFDPDDLKRFSTR